MVAFLVWLGAFVLLMGASLVACDSALERRSHFGARVLLLVLMAACAVLVIVATVKLNLVPPYAGRPLAPVLAFMAIPVLMLVPALLFRSEGSSSDPSDEEGGGGSGPDRPPSSPSDPRGGVPLPDADQACARVRDHTGPGFRRGTQRRPAREPERMPAPTRRDA
jgi:hypothetical protein